MAQRKLNFRFHNPNTAEVTAEYILEIFIEANKGKVERVLREAAESQFQKSETDRERPA
jgi:hypothetical protein